MLLVCHLKILYKYRLQFLLKVKMAPRETENNAYAKFWGDKQRELWYFPWWSIALSSAKHFHLLFLSTKTTVLVIKFIYSTFAGVIQFGIVADQSMENGVTADSVHPEAPLYSEEVAQVNSNASTLKMENPEPRYANLNVVREKPKNDQKGFFKIPRKLGSRLSNGRHERFAIFFPQLAVKTDFFDIFFLTL